jgi:Uma2 family endonuclease
MNEMFRVHALRSAELPPTTRAAEGLERRRWTVAEIEELTKAGVLDEDERFELIGGEIVPMNPKGIQHETLKVALNLYLATNLPEGILFAQETTFRLSEDSFVEPDFIFFRKSDGLAALKPRTALLAIEVADTSLSWDLGRKALIYAHCGVPELWVIDAVARATHVHRAPCIEGYTTLVDHDEHGLIPSSAVPGLALRLSDLDPV